MVGNGDEPSPTVANFCPTTTSGYAVIAPAGAWDGLWIDKYSADQAESTEPQAMVDAIRGGLDLEEGSGHLQPLEYDEGHILPTPTEEAFASIPAGAEVGDDGRFVLSAG
jgi:hypothetical protein